MNIQLFHFLRTYSLFIYYHHYLKLVLFPFFVFILFLKNWWDGILQEIAEPYEGAEN